MKVVVAMDSFKGSMTSAAAGEAVKKAVISVDPEAQVIVFPVADGGEGTVEALCASKNGQNISVAVTGPLGEELQSTYCILSDHTAVLEMATAAGITLVPPGKLNPLNTTTYGFGQMISDAVRRGCRRFIIGIGGSATNDGGVGMLRALGFRFYDEKDNEIPSGAKGLKNLKRIDVSGAIPELKECSFRVACDVTNPLCGPHGCSAVYGPQKGATTDMIASMDEWLCRYARISKRIFPCADDNFPGAGAAGGMGYAFRTFLNAELQAGIDIVLEEIGIEKYIQTADIIVTGEGRLDGQSISGKTPIGVAGLAKKYGKTAIAFAGCVTDSAILCNDYGIDAFFPIVRGITTLEEALNPAEAAKNLQSAVTQAFRLIYTQRKAE